jgi:hypothetical protein
MCISQHMGAYIRTQPWTGSFLFRQAQLLYKSHFAVAAILPSSQRFYQISRNRGCWSSGSPVSGPGTRFGMHHYRENILTCIEKLCLRYIIRYRMIKAMLRPLSWSEISESGCIRCMIRVVSLTLHRWSVLQDHHIMLLPSQRSIPHLRSEGATLQGVSCIG